MHDLKTRSSVSILSIIVVSLLTYYSTIPVIAYFYTFMFSLALAVALWEFYQFPEAKGFQPLTYIGILSGVSYVWALFLGLQFNTCYPFPMLVLAFALFLFLLFSIKFNKEPLINIGVSILGLAYVIIPLAFILKINFSPYLVISGRWWVMYLIIITKSTDIGAYFVGRLWGKTPIAPKISPKKTIEGLFGGISLAVLSSFILIFMSPHVRHSLKPAWVFALVIAVVLAILGQLSDLSESLFKRDANVKDSNKLKGLGGILDMLDSLIFNAPLFFLFLSVGGFI